MTTNEVSSRFTAALMSLGLAFSAVARAGSVAGADISAISPTGRFEMHKSPEADKLLIRDKTTQREHDISEGVYSGSQCEVSARWSPDGLMLLVHSSYPWKESIGVSQVIHWHMGKFTPLAVPKLARPIKWQGNEHLECELTVARIVDVSKLKTVAVPAADIAKQKEEVQALGFTPELKGTSPDGKFEVVRLTNEKTHEYTCLLRHAKSQEMIQTCFIAWRSGDLLWSPDSKFVFFHYQAPEAGVHNPPRVPC